MNENRFKLLIDTYGADIRRWPEDEVAAALTFQQSSPAAKQWLAEAQQVDNLLDRIDAGVEPGMLLEIQSRIETSFEQAHQTAVDRMINWLLPDVSAWATTLWRPTMAACLPLIVGISIGLSTTTDEVTLSSSEEIALLAISPTATEVWSYE